MKKPRWILTTALALGIFSMISTGVPSCSSSNNIQFDHCDKSVAAFDASIAGNPDANTMAVTNALMASLTAPEIEYLSNLDLRTLTANVFVSDPVMNKALRAALPVIHVELPDGSYAAAGSYVPMPGATPSRDRMLYGRSGTRAWQSYLFGSQEPKVVSVLRARYWHRPDNDRPTAVMFRNDTDVLVWTRNDFVGTGDSRFLPLLSTKLSDLSLAMSDETGQQIAESIAEGYQLVEASLPVAYEMAGVCLCTSSESDDENEDDDENESRRHNFSDEWFDDGEDIF